MALGLSYTGLHGRVTFISSENTVLFSTIAHVLIFFQEEDKKTKLRKFRLNMGEDQRFIDGNSVSMNWSLFIQL